MFLESIGKKTEFLNHVVSSMGLKDVKIIYSRAENVAHDSNFREQFDVVLSRAVAKLSILSEITIPFTKPGGDCIFFKGKTLIMRFWKLKKQFLFWGKNK
ncbi:MAG: hypothetical protein CM1200mP7_0640 [Chloroflexota bacterium]|nr:MAG: hypothetical protein CM1200mP7_0640 [Chloroflexota bacterium]